MPVWGWLVGWFGLVVFSPFLLGLCGLLGGLRPFVSLVWSCWHLLRRLPFTSARSTWGPFTSQSPHTIAEVNGCGELGTFEHICWCCPYRPPDLDIPPKPNEGLSSRYGWVITNQRADIVAVQDWLVYVQRLLWELAHPSA